MPILDMILDFLLLRWLRGATPPEEPTKPLDQVVEGSLRSRFENSEEGKKLDALARAAEASRKERD